MKTIIITLTCILFAGCVTPKATVPPPRTAAEMTAWMNRVAASEQIMDDQDYSSNIQFFDE